MKCEKLDLEALNELNVKKVIQALPIVNTTSGWCLTTAFIHVTTPSADISHIPTEIK